MRWFRRPSTSPRLISHANIASETTPDAVNDKRDNEKEFSRKSRIDSSKSRQSSEDSENEALHCYSVQTRLVVVDKPRRWRSEPRSSSSSAEDISERIARREAFILASREKRNPLLDHVKDTRLSCFPSSELLTQFPIENEAQPTETPYKEKFAKNPKLRKRNTEINESFNGNSCLSAKLKSITDRYLKCSSNNFFTKLYKNSDSEKSGQSSRRQRSFSYGSLPGLESSYEGEAPFFPGTDVAPDTEDCDSGIIVTDTSSLMDSKCVYHGRSVSSDQSSSSPSKTSMFNDSRSSWSSDQSRRSYKSTKRKKVSRRSASLDRREILRKYQTASPRSSVSPVPPESSKPDVSCKRVFKVVRLMRSCRNEEIGIFIAKTKFCGEGALGYLIAHIVPDGLAEREGSLQIGDEIVNVNGRRLRGLSMATAREVLCSGPLEVDIVVARPTPSTHTLSKQKPSRTMLESSVDYENVILKPKSEEVQPVCRLERELQPLASSSPTSRNCHDLHKAGNSMNPKMLRRALISYAGPEQDNKEISRVTSSCENLLDGKGPFSTLPRLPKSSICTFHTVLLEKGPGKKSLGFTIVGGKDSPRGPLGIFIKSILEGGQAADTGLLCVGDEILAVNGHVCHDLTHTEAVAIFKKFKIGPLSLHICRRAKSSRPPIKTKSCADLLNPSTAA